MFKYDDLIGVPFVDGGRTIEQGLDCYGLASLIYRRCGVELPDYLICCQDAEHINDAISIGRNYWHRLDIQEIEHSSYPCLLVIRFNQVVLCNHVGIYVGNGRFIHTREHIGVNVDRIDSPAWSRKIEGFYIPNPEVITSARTTSNHC